MAAGDSGAGRVVAGRYHLRQELGRGGMGVVWHARDTELDRDVAVKEVLVPDGLTQEQRDDAHGRVRREARSAARITHPSVITIFDVFDFDGHPWVVMQLVEGQSLDRLVRERGPLDPQQVARIAADLLEALRAAHAKGVIHRDVKPANVMLASNGDVFLTDFGIANIEGEAALTRTGAMIGSPEYMAPERLDGRTPPASDLWSLGATLYTLVEGRSPFQRNTVAETVSAVVAMPVPAPQRAGSLTPVIMGLLERDLSRRLSAERALELLERPARPDMSPPSSVAPPPAQPPPAAGTGPVAFHGATPATGSTPPSGYPAPPPGHAHAGTPPPWGHTATAAAPPVPRPRQPQWLSRQYILLGAAAAISVVLLLGAVAVGAILATGEEERPTPPETEVAEEEQTESSEVSEAEDAAGEGEDAGTAEHTALPECAAFEGGMLPDLVPNPNLTTDDSGEGSAWEWLDCQWNSESLGSGEVSGFVAVRLFVNEDTSTRTGHEESQADLDRDEATFETESVSGIGDEAISWYDDEDEVGCVGAVTANIYIQTCYDQQQDGQNWGTIPPDEAIAAATDLAVENVETLESHSY